MRLYLVRHGQAEPKSQDEDRHLSPAGRAEMEKVAAFLKAMKVSVSAIRHSDKARAAETAAILASVVRAQQGAQVQEGLHPNDSVRPWRKLLARTEHDVMIVGHLPFLNALASALLAGEDADDKFTMTTGSVLCLERDGDGAWRVRWMLGPGELP
jgi:phosphohistidine phosphatase